ncbi:MAG: formylglycine-generating enzyme family protein [Candidatus Glassbacteria bacterium]|nr:formylglycine-generating enzyme family protein [Candidatus Glassbacteria bacterium]
MRLIALVLLAACPGSGGQFAAVDTPRVVRDLAMVSIPAGSVMMGSDLRDDSDYPGRDKLTLFYEQPFHQVALDAFRISACEVTQAQYMAVMDSSNPSEFKGGGRLPVERVLWYEAAAFCNRLSRIAGLEPCYSLQTWECDFSRSGFRLPTEAEWMYAACAGSATDFHTGPGEGDLARAGWYSKNSGQHPHPVGLKEPNAWGLYDVHGNLWEWCNDWFGERYYRDSPVTSPAGPAGGTVRVVRGGGWLSDAFYCRSNCRAYSSPGVRRPDIGFRVVCRP